MRHKHYYYPPWFSFSWIHCPIFRSNLQLYSDLSPIPREAWEPIITLSNTDITSQKTSCIKHFYGKTIRVKLQYHSFHPIISYLQKFETVGYVLIQRLFPIIALFLGEGFNGDLYFMRTVYRSFGIIIILLEMPEMVVIYWWGSYERCIIYLWPLAH